MKKITASKPIGANGIQWPRHEAKTIEARKRDFIIRIADWTKDKYTPAYDVEVYVGGVYDWHESETFVIKKGESKLQAKAMAIEFAQRQTAKLL